MISLPIDSQLDDILGQLKSARNLVLSAAPGAGKTTRLPPRLLELTTKKVLVLEPRRMAAAAAAQRIAEERGWQLSQEVGYQVRFEKRFSTNTPLIFLTEALLLRRLINDPELSDTGIVVLDEFHERSIYCDLALGLLKELQELSRPDLKIVVMSATLQAEPIAKFLGDCPIISVPGKSFPLTLNCIKEVQLLQTNPIFISRVTKKVREVQATTEKDILVFLPGIGEIQRVFNELDPWCKERKIQLLRLHGSLPLNEQQAVLRREQSPRIVLSTNVAESSVTLDGVDTVIDTGLARVMSIHPRTGFPLLSLQRISLAAATQRAGRSARQFPGRCFRLWSKMDELSMPAFDTPEIQRSDLSETLLFLASFGVSDFSNFSWFEKPSAQALQRAVDHLKTLQALDLNSRLTELGRDCLLFPLPPRLAKLMLFAEKIGQQQLGADLCSLLLERDALPKGGTHSETDSHTACDLTYRWEFLQDWRQKKQTQGADPNKLKNIDRISEQLAQIARGKPSPIDKKQISYLVAATFADRICRRRKKGEPFAIMRDGRGITLAKTSTVRGAEFFLAIDPVEGIKDSESMVSLATEITKEAIEREFLKQIQIRFEVYFDKSQEKFFVKEFRALDRLPLEDARIRSATAAEAQTHLPNMSFDSFAEILTRNQNFCKWWNRYQLFCQSIKQEVFTDEQIRSALQQACYGENSLKSIYEKDLIYFFELELGPQLARKLNSDFPNMVLVPSGSQIPIHYEKGKPPFIEVRLQEVFTWATNPKIFNDSIPLTLHLLGPNYRPVQVTADLASFWKTAYPEVRSELRARYPKHSWPDDPLTALAVAKGRRRN